jgi:predicted GIY-YIG superfamily endonuclease
MKTQTLYRFFDSDGRLLYVGISKFFEARLKQHYRNSSWFFDSVTCTLEHFDTREQVEQAESLAIKTENPIHNKAGLPGYESPLNHFAKIKSWTYSNLEPDNHHKPLIDMIKLRLNNSGADYKRQQSRWVAMAFIEAYEILTDYDIVTDRPISGCQNCDAMHSSDSINDWSASAYKELRSLNATY